MRKPITVRLLATVAILLGGLTVLCGQEQNKPPEDTSARAEHRTGVPGSPGTSGEKPIHAYRVEFVINEMEGDKKINSRHYSMVQTLGAFNEIKIGTRVPISTPEEPGHVLEVGTSINCRLTESGDDVAIEVHSDFSNFSASNEAQSARPVVRQIRLSGSTVVTTGKSVLIGTAEDPSSTRQFQLEAMVTRLK